MATVGDLVTRVRTEYLEPPDEMGVRVALTSPVDDTTTTWPIELDLLGQEEKHLLSVGVLAEAGSEQVLIKGLDGADATVARGIRGTTPQSHTAGQEVLIQPAWTRDATFRAISENITSLHPFLFTTNVDEFETGAHAIVEIPDTVVSVTSVRQKSNMAARQFEQPFDWPDSDTGRAIRVFGASGSVVVSYQGKFPAPASEAATLADLGVREEWGRIVVVGAAAQLIAGRSLSDVQMRHVTEQMRAENWPVQTPNRIATDLLRLRAFLLQEAAHGLAREANVDVQLLTEV